MSDVKDSTFPPEGEGHEEAPDTRGRFESLFRDAIRRAVEKSVEAGVETLNRAKGVVDDVPLPKEMAGYFFSQVDETKNALVRVVAREVRDFLDATDLASELQRALTSLSFEIRTEVRFIPNDAGGVRPVFRQTPKVRKSRPPSEAPPAEPEEETGVK